MPKVSVIIPVYGVEKYIERCARSLFEQTLDDIEYLFVDDCTPDRSIEILKQVLEDYPLRKLQATIHHMEKNSGQAAVRKWGMLNATGEYVIHCDSDDWVETDMYRAMYEKAKEENVDVVVCDYVVHNGKNVEKTVRGCHNDKIKSFRDNLLFQREKWSLCNKLFRRACYNKDIIYPTADMGEDMVITLQLIFRCQNLAYIPYTYYYYYFNRSSITKQKDPVVHVSNFYGMRENVNIVIKSLENEHIKHKKWIKNGLFYAVTQHLFCIMHDNKNYRSMWLHTYPGFHLMYFINPYMNAKSKIKCILAFIGVYPPKAHRIK